MIYLTLSYLSSTLRVYVSVHLQQVSHYFAATALRHVNRPRSIREEHLIKEHCGFSGIMGYVTFHHKTRRGPLIVPCLHEKQPLSCFSQLRGTKWHITKADRAT